MRALWRTLISSLQAVLNHSRSRSRNPASSLSGQAYLNPSWNKHSSTNSSKTLDCRSCRQQFKVFRHPRTVNHRLLSKEPTATLQCLSTTGDPQVFSLEVDHVTGIKLKTKVTSLTRTKMKKTRRTTTTTMMTKISSGLLQVTAVARTNDGVSVVQGRSLAACRATVEAEVRPAGCKAQKDPVIATFSFPRLYTTHLMLSSYSLLHLACDHQRTSLAELQQQDLLSKA
jgi:hypothetical protein